MNCDIANNKKKYIFKFQEDCKIVNLFFEKNAIVKDAKNVIERYFKKGKIKLLNNANVVNDNDLLRQV